MKNISSKCVAKLPFPCKHKAFCSLSRPDLNHTGRIFIPLFCSQGALWHMFHLCSLDVRFSTLTLWLNFQFWEARRTRSDVAFGRSRLSCLNYLWLQHSWTAWAFPKSCQESSHHPSLPGCALTLSVPAFPHSTPVIYAIGLAAESVYLCVLIAALLASFYRFPISGACYPLGAGVPRSAAGPRCAQGPWRPPPAAATAESLLRELRDSEITSRQFVFYLFFFFR